MKRKTVISLLLSAGLAISSSTAISAESETDAQKLASVEKAVALNALSLMSTYLHSLDKFTVNADVNVDVVLENGQKVQVSKSVEIIANPPSGLVARSSNMYSEKEFYFDGQTFTLNTPKLGLYASVDMPGTIGEALAKVEDSFGVEFPLVDLFYWGTDADSVAGIEEAMIVGIDKIDGVSCNHFAFRQQEIDWQICIQRGDTPLPLKLVITSKDEVAQPQHASLLKWDTAPSLSGQSFTFAPREGDSKISFGTVDADK